MSDTTIAAIAPNARCVMRQGAWTPLPFERVSLGPEVAQFARQERVIWGPYTRIVVIDSTNWAAVWHAATDTAYSLERARLPDGRDSVLTVPTSVPPIQFGTNAIVFVTTKTYSWGPSDLVITSIRRCRRTGVVVVNTLETFPRIGSEYPSRAFAAARLPRRSVEHALVVFVDRSRKVPIGKR